jgi:hypothetical protein
MVWSMAGIVVEGEIDAALLDWLSGHVVRALHLEAEVLSIVLGPDFDVTFHDKRVEVAA